MNYKFGKSWKDCCWVDIENLITIINEQISDKINCDSLVLYDANLQYFRVQSNKNDIIKLPIKTNPKYVDNKRFNITIDLDKVVSDYQKQNSIYQQFIEKTNVIKTNYKLLKILLGNIGRKLPKDLEFNICDVDDIDLEDFGSISFEYYNRNIHIEIIELYNDLDNVTCFIEDVSYSLKVVDFIKHPKNIIKKI